MTRMALRLLIFESCPVASAGLSDIIASSADMQLISETRSLDEAIGRLKTAEHDVIVMATQPGREDTCRTVRRLLCASKCAKLLVFSAQDGDGVILRALNAGATGYLLKNASREEIVQTIQYVATRERYLPPVIAQQVAEYIGKERLTDRELEVLGLVREGWRNRQIAIELRVAETTVNFHIKNTLAKLRANDRTHAVTIAMKRGLLPMAC